MGQRALVKPDKGLFFCWHRNCWQDFRKYRHCVRSGCRYMQVSPVLRWKAEILGGVLVLLSLSAGRAA